MTQEDFKEVGEEYNKAMKYFKPEFNNEYHSKIIKLIGENNKYSKEVIKLIDKNKEITKLMEDICNNKKAIIFLLGQNDEAILASNKDNSGSKE